MSILLPGPTDIAEVWWKEVCKKVKKAVIFLDDFVAESLHWSGGQERLFKAGATGVKQLSSFEKCPEGDKKAVFLLSSPILEISRDVIRDIVSTAKLSYVIVITGAHPSVHTYCQYGGREEEESALMSQLENDLLMWMGNMNFTAEIFYYPLFVVPVTRRLFLLPKFIDLFPLLGSDIEQVSQLFNQLPKGDQIFIDSLKDVEFQHLPRRLRIAIRHLVSFFHSLFQGMNAREEIFSLGTTARIVATELESHGPARHRRKTAPNKVSLVLIDRTLDLASPASNMPESFLNRVMSLLPKLPGHTVDCAVNIGPLSIVHSSCEWTLLPGCLAHPLESDAQHVLEKLVHSKRCSAIDEIKLQISELSSTSIKESGEMKLNQAILERITPLASDPEKMLAHFGVIQQGLAIAECLSHPRYSLLDQICRFEEELLHTIFDSEDETSLNEVVHLLKMRKTQGVSIDDILGLAIYASSLGTDCVVNKSMEYSFTNALSQSIIEDKDHLSDALQKIIGGEVNEVSAFKASANIWERLLSISMSRDDLKDYRHLVTRENKKEPFVYKNLLHSLIKDCLSTPQVQMNDLECRSAGFKNMIKSGFSLFVNVSKPMPRDAASMIIYVIGGISANEILDITQLIESQNPPCQVLLASSHITCPADTVCQTLAANPLLEHY